MTIMTTNPQTQDVTGIIKVMGVTLPAVQTPNGKVFVVTDAGGYREASDRQARKFEPAEDVHGTIMLPNMGKSYPAVQRGPLITYTDEHGKTKKAVGYLATKFVAN